MMLNFDQMTFVGVLGAGAKIAFLLVIAVLILVFIVVGVYNGLVRARNAFRNAFAQIDVQLTRRHDLIPNLVETAKAFMAHERETLEAVIAARNQAVSSRSSAAANPSDSAAVSQLLQAEGQLSGCMTRFFAVAEAYPQLTSNQNMLQLTEELTSTENKVSFARQAYNDAVTAYNTRRETFPTVLIAGMFGFAVATLYEVSQPQERLAVKVSF